MRILALINVYLDNKKVFILDRDDGACEQRLPWQLLQPVLPKRLPGGICIVSSPFLNAFGLSVSWFVSARISFISKLDSF